MRRLFTTLMLAMALAGCSAAARRANEVKSWKCDNPPACTCRVGPDAAAMMIGNLGYGVWHWNYNSTEYTIRVCREGDAAWEQWFDRPQHGTTFDASKTP